MPQNFAAFEDPLKGSQAVAVKIGQTIKSTKKVAVMMAGKARLLSDIIKEILASDETNKEG